MNKKRSLFVMFGLFVILLSFSLVIAQENETMPVDNETENEVDVMQRNSFGTEMMLHQLKRNIGIKIFQANAVIDYVQERGNDTSNLEAIVVLLEDLNLSIDSIDTTNRTEAVKEFIDIKLQAKDLVEQFRNESHLYLNENDRRSLRAQFISIERDRLNTLRERIRNSEREFLKEQAGKVLDIIGRNKERIMERISNDSNFTSHQVRLEIRNEYNNLSEGGREEARLRLREDAIEGKRQRAAALEEAKKNREQRLSDIMDKRMEILRQRGLENASVGSSNFSNWVRGQGR